uniref:G_PROTEIN_RECEP_F1_2 domain-containing protein n=1 Tax=Rhabditophanes sp. KR3021 TaxID=114890 RepID=A0AC35TLE1_9BILA
MTAIILHTVVVIAIFKSPNMKSCYGYLTLTLFLSDNVYVFSCTYFLNIRVYYPYLFDEPLIQLLDAIVPPTSFIFDRVYLLCHLFLSINRFLSIYMPINYKLIFSKNNTRLLMFFIILAPMISILPMFFVDHCNLIFNEEYETFIVLTNFCSQLQIAFLHAYFIYFTGSVCFVLDIFVLKKLFHIKKGQTGINENVRWLDQSENRYAISCISLNFLLILNMIFQTYLFQNKIIFRIQAIIYYIAQPAIFFICNGDVRQFTTKMFFKQAKTSSKVTVIR